MRGGTEVDKSYKRRLYSTLKELSDNAAPPQEMRIVKKWPTIDWKVVLRNLVETPSLESDIVHWYNVIHDVIPTNERLQCIRISPTDGCNVCDRKVTLSHRLTECGEGRDTWALVQSIIARMLRTIPARVPVEWLLRPSFCIWPPQRHRAVLWVLSQFVTFRIHHHPTLTSNDLTDFLRRTKWKMYQTPKKCQRVANYLTVSDALWE